MRLQQAFDILQVDKDADSETCKKVFRERLLALHPDKNPSPTAKEDTQNLISAHQVIKRFHDGHSSDSENEIDLDGDDFDDEGIFFDFDDFIRIYLFQRYAEMRFRATQQRASAHKRMSSKEAPASETYEEMRRRKEKLQRDEATRKAFRKQEQELERLAEQAETERRRAEKAEKRKQAVSAERAKALEAQRARIQAAQVLRSATFAAARRGKIEQVKKAIYEQDVNAAGVENEHGGLNRETLLHIIARLGDAATCEWLLNHGAELAEKNAAGFSAFAQAVKSGKADVVSIFLSLHPNDGPEGKEAYSLPNQSSFLDLAIESKSVDTVKAIISSGLVKLTEVSAAWTSISTKLEKGPTDAFLGAILHALEKFDGFRPHRLSRKPAALGPKKTNASSTSGKEDAVTILASMGFARADAIAALKQSGGSIELATTHLLEVSKHLNYSIRVLNFGKNAPPSQEPEQGLLPTAIPKARPPTQEKSEFQPAEAPKVSIAPPHKISDAKLTTVKVQDVHTPIIPLGPPALPHTESTAQPEEDFNILRAAAQQALPPRVSPSPRQLNGYTFLQPSEVSSRQMSPSVSTNSPATPATSVDCLLHSLFPEVKMQAGQRPPSFVQPVYTIASMPLPVKSVAIFSASSDEESTYGPVKITAQTPLRTKTRFRSSIASQSTDSAIELGSCYELPLSGSKIPIVRLPKTTPAHCDDILEAPASFAQTVVDIEDTHVTPTCQFSQGPDNVQPVSAKLRRKRARKLKPYKRFDTGDFIPPSA